MLVDIGSELLVARVIQHVRLLLLRRAVILLASLVDIVDPVGTVVHDCVIGDRLFVIRR